MDTQIERNFKELFANVSRNEKEQNRALLRQTEKLRQIILRLRMNRTDSGPRESEREESSNVYAVAGEYALHR